MLSDFDPFSAETIESPYEFYGALREHAPVYRLPNADYWVASRYSDIKSVSLDVERFSSNLTAIVLAQADGSLQTMEVGQSGAGAVDVLAIADPPAHTRQRKLTAPRFSMRLVRGREERVRELASALVDSFAEEREVDWMSAFAFPLPMTVILEIIGFPLGDREQVKSFSDGAVALLSGVLRGEEMTGHVMAVLKLFEYVREHFRSARKNPGDDLLGLIANATGSGEDALTEDEAVSIIVQLLIAGNESTSSLIGSAIRLLAEHLEVQSELRADPSRIPLFVEEVLRLETPFQGHFRKTKQACTLAGTELPQGARLMLLWASGNRDEREFRHAASIDLDRPNLRTHLGFGHGIHFCLGAQLARLEARIALEEILRRSSQIELNGTVRHLPSVFVRTPSTLPIRLDLR